MEQEPSVSPARGGVYAPSSMWETRSSTVYRVSIAFDFYLFEFNFEQTRIALLFKMEHILVPLTGVQIFWINFFRSSCTAFDFLMEF